MRGGVADVSETHAALACGTIVELVALPFWALVTWLLGPEIFTKDGPPRRLRCSYSRVFRRGPWVWTWFEDA